jgi:HD-GYP domain-containing protein (c-di-GMP phosphodiesterase class II)
VRSSHERFDGSGYPDALSRADHPAGKPHRVRLDAFHAMTSDRPYGTAMSVEKALAELSRCTGTQFDPDVVIAFRAARVASPSPRLIA